MRKSVSVIYLVFLAAGCILMLIAICTPGAVVEEAAPASAASQAVPASVDEGSPGVHEYAFDFSGVGEKDNDLMVYTSHQYIEVLVNGEVRYAVRPGEGVFGRSPGAMWSIVEIGTGRCRVLVRLTDAYEHADPLQPRFLRGDALRWTLETVRRSMPELMVSIIDVAAGILLLAYCAFAHSRVPSWRCLFYFGLFAFMMGLWSFNEAEATGILLSNHAGASFCGYMLLMLMISPFVAFIQEFLEVERRWICNVLCLICTLNFIVCTLMHMGGIREFKETAWVTHLLMFCVLGYLVYAIRARSVTHGADRKVWSSVFGLVMLSGAYVADIFAYYIGASSTDVFARFGFLLYIIVLGAEAASEAVVRIQEGRKAEIYKELAVKDMLTKLYNRNAYDRYIKERQPYRGTVVVMCDLNDLKRCNDTIGHQAGDAYIKGAAEILYRVFEPAGKCFRIGGDEFCIIVENAKESWVEERIKEMCFLEREFNKDSGLVNMQIAYGYAFYDESRDVSLENTKNRADERMYEKKKELKKERGDAQQARG